MNREIIRRHNERVKPEDVVFHIGDFCFKNSPGGKEGEGVVTAAAAWEKKLNGKIIHVRGNHDRNNSTRTIIEKMHIRISNRDILLIHNPAHIDGVKSYDLYFVGHVHNNWKIKRKTALFGLLDMINVGVDVWDFYPQTINEILSRYAKWKREVVKCMKPFSPRSQVW